MGQTDMSEMATETRPAVASYRVVAEGPREFVERVNLRGCIYRQQVTMADKRGVTLWFVGKDATRPCVIVDPTNNIATIDNLGWFTPSTTRAINLTLENYRVQVWQERWGHRVIAGSATEGRGSVSWVAPRVDMRKTRFLRYAINLSSGRVIDAPVDAWSL